MRHPVTAVVVGASGGIGAAVAQRLLADGMRVYGTFFSNENAAAALRKTSASLTMLKCDLRSGKSISETVDKILKESGSPEHLVLSAAPKLKLKPFDDLSEQDFREDMDTLYWGSFYILKKILPLMKKARFGRVATMISSTIADFPSRMSSYTVAKSALAGLTTTLSSELVGSGITFMNLSPYFVETDLIKAFPAKLLEIERSKSPSGAFLSPEDIARLTASFLKDKTRVPMPVNVLIKTKEDLERYL